MATPTKTDSSKVTSQDIKNIAAATAQAPADDFENPNVGEVFGGSYDRLTLTENEVSPLFTYVKDTKIQLEDQKNPGTYISEKVPVGEAGGKLISMPICAIFKKNWKEANVQSGDTFKVKRYPNTTKRRGAGAGNKMESFAVKVYSRAAKASATPAS
jgi:hypothetical protein